MSQSKRKSTKAIISERQLRKMTMILSDRWLETQKIVQIRNSVAKNPQRHRNLWIEQISL
ncbi:MAG: hypothetical protein AAGE84_04525 [Cyanobacteria bacterium P01_G01_bin.39]